MHIATPDGKHTLCHHTGEQERTADITLADCSTCLWALVSILLKQMSGAMRRLYVVERSKTVRPNQGG